MKIDAYYSIPNFMLQESKMFDGKGMHKIETHYKV